MFARECTRPAFSPCRKKAYYIIRGATLDIASCLSYLCSITAALTIPLCHSCVLFPSGIAMSAFRALRHIPELTVECGMQLRVPYHFPTLPYLGNAARPTALHICYRPSRGLVQARPRPPSTSGKAEAPRGSPSNQRRRRKKETGI